MAENQEEILEEEEKRLAEEAEKRKREEAAAEAQNLKFRTKDDVYEGFAYLTQNKYGEASEEEIKEFIRHKNAYIVAHPEEAEEIAKHIKTEMYSKEEKIYGNDLYYISADFPDKYTKALNKLLRSDNTEDLIAKYENTPQDNVNDEPIDEPLTVEMHAGQDEKSRVPNLAQSLTELGYNNAEITDKLNEVIDRLPDGRKKEMYTKVRDAYVTRNGIVALNDLLVNEKDVTIAKEIVGTLGYEGQESVFPYPEMEKHIEPFVAPAPTPTPVVTPGPEPRPEPKPEPKPQPQPRPQPFVTPTPQPGIEQKQLRIRSHDNFDNESAMYRVELEILSESKLIDKEAAQKGIEAYTELLRERDILNGLSEEEAKNFESKVSVEELAAGYDLVNEGRAKISEKDTDKYKRAVAYRIVDNVLDDKERGNIESPWYGLLTPEVTAVSIEGLRQDLKNKNMDEEKRETLQSHHNILLQHGENLLADLTKKQGYFFTDITNAADEYDGYMHLADVCEQASKEQNKAEQQDNIKDNEQTTVYENARRLMNEYVEPYDKLYNIPSGENPKDTTIDLNDRFNKASEIIDKLEFDETTLGKDYLEALSRFEFVKECDNEGNATKIEDCLEQKDGKLCVIKGSSLDTALKFAANEAMMQNLGNFSQKMDEKLIVEGMKDNAFKTLFAYSNSEEVVKLGLREDPYKFTDKNKEYVEEFKQKLMSGQKMQISPLGAKLALDRQANHVETFSNRLTAKLGKENTEYLKAGLLGQVKRIDKTSRYSDGAKKVKDAALKRSLIGAGVGFGLATVASYATTKLSLGAVLGIGKTTPLAVGMAAEFSIGWGNAAIGAVAGAAISTTAFLAVKSVGAMMKGERYKWQDIKKDIASPQFLSALTAGALGGASVGFATCGCAQCAMACGMGSVAAASLGRFYAPYRDMRLHGHGRVKSAVMGVLNAAAVIAGGQLGHHLGSTNNQMEITANEKQAKELYQDTEQAKKDGWNLETSDHKQDGFTLLDTKEGSGWKATDELIAKAKSTLDWFYGHNSDALNHDLEQVRAQLHALGRDDISPEVFLRDACDAGMNTGVDTINHVDGGGIVHTHGNNLVMTDLWAQQHGVSIDSVHALGGIKAPDGTITIAKEAIAGYEAIKLNVSDINQIGSTLNADGSRLAGHLDGVLYRDAMVDSTNTTVHAPEGQGTEFNTYANGNHGFRHTLEEIYGRFTKSVEAVSGFGATILSWPHKVKQFLRPGAKADRIAKVEKHVVQSVERPVGGGTIVIPGGENIGGGTVIIGEDKKKPYVKPIMEIKEPQVDIKKLLDDEYKIVYGVAPSPTSEVSYKKLVMEEFKADREAGTTKAENLAQYLTERKATYDEKLTQTVDPLAETKGYHETKQGQEATAQARQEMFQTNLSFNGEELPRNQMTLQKFTRFATFALSNGADRDNVTAAHDNSIAASKKERPSGGRFDVGTGKVSGQTTNGGKGVKDGKTGSLQNPKGKGRE